jgi:hypothetical protein
MCYKFSIVQLIICTFCELLYINYTNFSVVSYIRSQCNMISSEIFPCLTVSVKLAAFCRTAWIIIVAKGPAFLVKIFRDFPQPVLANAETAHKSFFYIILKSSLVNPFGTLYTICVNKHCCIN